MMEVKKMANNDREIEELQNNLETLRKLFGWTAEQLGDRLGITKQSVLNLEKGPNRGGVKMSKIQYIAIRAIFEAEANSRKGEEKENLLTVLGLVFNNNPEITSEQRQSALDTAKVVSSATVSGNKYSRIFVVNLGDSLDNYSKETARGGHILPTVMTNKEQAHTYIEVMMSFFNSLKEEFDSEIYYYCIGDSNHGSDWEWAVNNILAEKLTAININCYISNNKIDQFEVDGNVFLYLHGDDSGDMKSGFPATLNPKTENWFNSYIIENKIVADKDIYVVKGHSHVYAVNMAKSFIYMSAASLYGASNWMTANFGKTPWGVNFSEVKNGIVITGLINN